MESALEQQVNLVNALALARERGIVIEERSAEAPGDFGTLIHTEVTTEQGLLHDDWYLGLVYEVLRFDPSDSPRQREHIVEEAKARYAALLRRFAAGDIENLTPHERRILHDFGDKTTPAQWRDDLEAFLTTTTQDTWL